MWIFNSLIIAIAMYSKIPMPQAEWNEKNMRYDTFSLKKYVCKS